MTEDYGLVDFIQNSDTEVSVNGIRAVKEKFE
jgi:hypothetical protein